MQANVKQSAKHKYVLLLMGTTDLVDQNTRHYIVSTNTIL
jgi:hypothetical protein